MTLEASSLLDPLLPDTRGTVRWGQLYGSAAALALSRAAQSARVPLLVVAEDVRQAERLATELPFFTPAGFDVLEFPDWETLAYDPFSPHPDIISRRLETLSRLPTLDQGIVVTAAPTLLQRIAPRTYVDGAALLFERGEQIDAEHLSRRFERAGYLRVPQVREHGEYALRGSLIDLFPMGNDEPFRIDLFDDVIETIRGFDPDSQRSTEEVDHIRLLPAREFPMTDESIDRFRRSYRRRFEGDPSTSVIYRDVSNGLAPSGIEAYLPLFFEQTALFTDYLSEQALVAVFDTLADGLEQTAAEIEERYEQRRHDIERPLLAPQELHGDPAELFERLGQHGQIVISIHELEPTAQSDPWMNAGTSRPPSVRLDPRTNEPGAVLKEFVQKSSQPTLFVAESPGRREMLSDLMRQQHIEVRFVDTWDDFVGQRPDCALTVAPLETGMTSAQPGFVVVAEEQMFGEAVRRRRRRPARDPESVIRHLTDLSEGSPVVHEDYGVGRYLGLKTLEIGGVETEFLTLEYAGGDKLYVPVHALHLISRYSGAPSEHAPLHRLGSDQWTRAKRKAAEKARDVAAELLDIYARRAATRGVSFRVDEPDYLAFEAGFPFEETIDQETAIAAVLDDLKGTTPMDRVVCGDVGFGKTEVALRAAFVAVDNGKQVGVLVPTTLLAQQHHQVFTDRFADWPVRVETLSRFRSRKQTKEIVDGLKNGTVDIVIGTHKLLGDDVVFKDLGLIVVDEEHRFGVRHKERLKSLRSQVDVLTLTATPIPRTLNMALGGLRDLSPITTPPHGRLAIKTFVCDWHSMVIREAVLREIKRGGQVYFVHNTVKTIDKAARELQKLVPEATIRVGHGRMRERELERVMLDFYHRRFNVLVCSTIIESGLDVPTANTIIINRADQFGLAQLHQLRGRVGRSHHRAYAYLISPPRAVITADARKRLEAIESMEDLGSGFILATHDLEIRGAGELLGDVQSGQIHEVGFTMYTEMLERAVRALKSGREPDLERPLYYGPEIDLQVPALIPDSYLPDVHLRLILYKRIASARNNEEQRELQVELIDRFGLLPDPTKTLFRLTALKLKAAPLGIRSIKLGTAGGRVRFTERPNVDPQSVIRLVQGHGTTYQFDGQDRLRIVKELDTFADRYREAEHLLDALKISDATRTNNESKLAAG